MITAASSVSGDYDVFSISFDFPTHAAGITAGMVNAGTCLRTSRFFHAIGKRAPDLLYGPAASCGLNDIKIPACTAFFIKAVSQPVFFEFVLVQIGISFLYKILSAVFQSC